MVSERGVSLVFRQEVILNSPQILRLGQVFNAYQEQHQQYRSQYPRDDVRPWTFQKVAQILAYYRLSIEYSQGILSRTDNLAKILEPGRQIVVPPDRAAEILKEFEQYITFSFFHVVFSSIESSMRSLVGQVPVRDSRGRICRGTAKFYDVYHGLIDVTGVDAEYRNLFELLLLMRNCIHNRSLYFSDKGDKKVTYRGTPYNFIQGKPIEFASVGLIFDFLLDVKEFFAAMYLSERMQQEKYIPDDVL
jgi:hypothetical protein